MSRLGPSSASACAAGAVPKQGSRRAGNSHTILLLLPPLVLVFSFYSSC